MLFRSFSTLVESTKTDPTLFRNLLDAISVISKKEPFWRKPGLDEKLKAKLQETLQETLGEEWESVYRRYCDYWGIAFSDSLVLSAPDDLEGLFNLTHALWMLAREMLGIGVLLRGGISLGLIYHFDRTVFGPALIDAYRLENKVAIYPHILFSDEVIEAAKQFSPRKEDPKNSEFYSQECCLLMRRDFDGLYHLDYLNNRGLLLDITTKHQGPSLEQLREKVQKELKASCELRPNIRAKWQWTLRYVETTMESLDTDAT